MWPLLLFMAKRPIVNPQPTGQRAPIVAPARTSVGKVNKKALREMHAAGELSMSRTPPSDASGRF